MQKTSDNIAVSNPRKHSEYRLTTDPADQQRWFWAVDVTIGAVEGSVRFHNDRGYWQAGSLVDGAWSGQLEELLLERDPSDLVERVEAAARAVLP
jgi:hypothetical protein